MKRISLFLKEKIDLLALLVCGSFSGCWMLILGEKYYYFKDGFPWDVAFHAQSLWALLHGSMSPSMLGANLIANHCTFLCFLLAPIYWVSPDPVLLQYLKVWGFFTGAYVFFLLLKKMAHPFIALGGMIAFSLAPANIAALNFVFNYEPFAIPLVFLIFKAFDENKFWPYIIFCFLLAMVKEQMPLIVVMFGIFALLFKKEDKIKWALIPLLMGLTIFIIEIFILTPYFRKDLPSSQSFHWIRYTQFGKTPSEILLFLFMHPLTILAQLTSAQTIRWYNDLFGIWGTVALLSPQILLLPLPLFLKSILSNHPNEHLVTVSYYAATFTPFIFLAAWNTLNQIQGKWRLPIHSFALMLMLIHALCYLPSLWPSTNLNANTLAKERFIDRIPPNASVLSGWTTLGLLANRPELYSVFNYLNGSYFVSEKKFKLPGDTDYLLLDFTDEWQLNAHRKKFIPKMTALNFDSRWQLQESIEDIALYVKNPSRQKASRLIERSFKPFAVKNTRPQIFDRTISLEAAEFPKIFPQKYHLFPVTMYWQCLKKTNIPYDILFIITSPDGRSYYIKQRPLGSTIYPTDFWRKGEHIKESYVYLLPHLQQGDFGIQLLIYNTANRKWVGETEYNFTIQ